MKPAPLRNGADTAAVVSLSRKLYGKGTAMAIEKTYRIRGVAYDYYSKLNEEIMERYIAQNVLAELTAWKSNFVAPADAKHALYTVRDWSIREIKHCPYCGSRELEREPDYQKNFESFEQYNLQPHGSSAYADDSNAFLFTHCRACDRIFYTSPVDVQNADLRILAVRTEFARELERYGEPVLKEAYWAWSIPAVPYAVAAICRHHGLLAGERPRLRREGHIVDTETYVVGDEEYAFASEENLRRKEMYLQNSILLDVTAYKEKLAASEKTPNPIYRRSRWDNWPDPAPREMVTDIDGRDLSESYILEMQRVYGANILSYMRMYVVEPLAAELLKEHGEPVLIDVNGAVCLWADMEYPKATMRRSINETCFSADVLDGQSGTST